MLNRLEIPDGFQKNNFKDQMREGYPRVCDWLVHNSLMIDGAITRLRHRGKHYPSFITDRSGLQGHDQQVVNFFSLVEALASVKQVMCIRFYYLGTSFLCLYA